MSQCIYVVKRGNKVIQARMRQEWLDMLTFCWAKLRQEGYQANMKVVFQTMPSAHAKDYYGIYHYGRLNDTIYIYTFGRGAAGVNSTIAHEFGHAKHYHLIPESHEWNDHLMEAYARWFEEKTVKEFQQRHSVEAKQT